MDNVDDVLAHYGIKGMRWGVRRADGPDGNVSSNPAAKIPPADDAVKALAYKKIAKSSGTQSLSNEELKLLLTRVELETKYSKAFGSNEKKGGKKFVQELLREEGKKQARSVASAAAAVAVANAFAKRSGGAAVPVALATGVALKLGAEKVKS